MVNDTVADLLARIQNGIIAKRESINAPVTKMNRAILEILNREKMIGNYAEENNEFVITLLYRENGEPEIQSLQKVSKLGQRMYLSNAEIVPTMNGRGISIFSTSSGVMTGAQAKAKGIGGELICVIW